MSIESVRSEIVANALWGVAHEGQIHYRQSRPIDGINHKHKLPLTTDCSGFATLCYNWAGAPDPNGAGYNGSGYTGTLLNHLDRVARANLRPGDLVVFGPAPGRHVVVVVGSGADPDVVSHGQERGPIRLKLSAEAAAQPKPMTFLTSRRVGLAEVATEEEEGIVEQVTLPLDLATATNPPAEA
jgi:hypothetical protein